MSKRVIAIAVVFGIALGAIAALALVIRTTPEPRMADPARTPPVASDGSAVLAEIVVDAGVAPSDAPSAPSRPVPKTPNPKIPAKVPAPRVPAPTTPEPKTPDPKTLGPTDPPGPTTPATIPATTPTTTPPPPLSPQERAARSKELRHDGDIAFMDKSTFDEALRLFTQAYELVPDAENTFRIARWHYISKEYPVALQWAKRAEALHPTGQTGWQVTQLLGWVRTELTARGLPTD